MSDFPYPLTPVEVLQRGRENLIEFNDLFYYVTGLNAWDISLPAAWRTPGFDGLCIKDQSRVGSCVGFGSAYFIEMLYMAITGDFPSDADKKLVSDSKTAVDGVGNSFMYQDYYPTSFSPWMAWGNARGWSSCGSDCGGCGAGIGDAFTQMQNNGLCRSSTWLTPMDNCSANYPSNQIPNRDPVSGESAATQGLHYRIKNAATITDPANHLDEVKLAMYLNGGAVAGIMVWGTPLSGVWPCGNNLLGGHAIGLVGWNEQNAFLNVNSWGTGYPHIGTITPEFMACGGFFEADTGTPLGTWPRLPGRPAAFSINPLLLGVGLIGATVGGYALWKKLGNKRRTFEDIGRFY